MKELANVVGWVGLGWVGLGWVVGQILFDRNSKVELHCGDCRVHV